MHCTIYFCYGLSCNLFYKDNQVNKNVRFINPKMNNNGMGIRFGKFVCKQSTYAYIFFETKKYTHMATVY